MSRVVMSTFRSNRSTQTATELAAVLANGTIPPGMESLAITGMEFCQFWFSWIDRDEDATEKLIHRQHGHIVGHGPHRKVWREFWPSLITARERLDFIPEVKQKETVSELLKQGCEPRAVAHVFGIRDEAGNWSGPFSGFNETINHEAVFAQRDWEESDGQRRTADACRFRFCF